VWIGELPVVNGAHHLGLQIYAGRFETIWWVEMAWHFSQGKLLLGLGSAWCGVSRLSTGYGSSMLQGSVLFDALSSAF
jgi:hypothetical protein